MANCGVVKGPAWHQQRLRCLTALVVGVAIMGACAPLSVAPVVGEGQATDVPGLAGRWVGEDGDTTVIAPAGVGSYALSFRDDGGGTTRFRARAGHLGNRLVLDVSAQLEKNDAAGLTETLLGTLIPGHMLVVLEPKGDSLRAAMLEQDSLRSALRSGKARTASLDLDGALVLTAPTDSLRAFLAVYLERPGALGDWGKFTRVPAVTPPSGR